MGYRLGTTKKDWVTNMADTDAYKFRGLMVVFGNIEDYQVARHVYDISIIVIDAETKTYECIMEGFAL